VENLNARILHDFENFLEENVKALCIDQSSLFAEMVNYHMGWLDSNHKRGKRIRPLLLLLSVGAWGADWNTALPAAAAIETLHNFTLIHDDIQDNSDERHGKATLWKIYGIPQAINSGDAMFAISQLLILKLQDHYDESVALQASTILNQATRDLAYGQFLDISFEQRESVSTQEYLEMIKLKTGVLIRTCTKIAAILAGQNQGIVSAAAEFGLSLGLAFQILDDYLGVWGDPSTTGKPASIDLIDRKKSLPILFGLSKSEEFNRLWKSSTMSVEEVKALSNQLLLINADSYTQYHAKYYTDLALRAFEKLNQGQNEYGESLVGLADALLSRNK